ncbi:kinase-like domain-containing protein [Pelagophyceae sp. CCMP2097]|nr:kinase-like domain-containing protein [Pelagophyceae sp. CCMP2097]
MERLTSQNPRDLTREELENAYVSVVEYAGALQDRQEQVCDAFRTLRCKYQSLKESNTDLLWNRLIRADQNDMFDMPPLNATIEETAVKIGPYTLGNRLGVGSYAEVKEGVDTSSTTHEVFAIKIIEKSKITRYQTLKRLHNEIMLMTELHHANIAILVDAIHTGSKLYLVLEHGGVDLFSYMTSVANTSAKQLNTAQTRSITQQLVAGVSVLRERGIVHHDIKPENILVDDSELQPEPKDAKEKSQVGRIRLTDFGMAQQYAKGERGTAFCGSPGFFAPEMVTDRDYDPFKIDAWSTGAVVLEMLLGRQWFTKTWLSLSSMTSDKEMYRNATTRAVQSIPAALQAANLPPAACEFVVAALTVSTGARPDARALCEQPWIATSRWSSHHRLKAAAIEARADLPPLQSDSTPTTAAVLPRQAPPAPLHLPTPRPNSSATSPRKTTDQVLSPIRAAPHAAAAAAAHAPRASLDRHPKRPEGRPANVPAARLLPAHGSKSPAPEAQQRRDLTDLCVRQLETGRDNLWTNPMSPTTPGMPTPSLFKPPLSKSGSRRDLGQDELGAVAEQDACESAREPRATEDHGRLTRATTEALATTAPVHTGPLAALATHMADLTVGGEDNPAVAAFAALAEALNDACEEDDVAPEALEAVHTICTTARKLCEAAQASLVVARSHAAVSDASPDAVVDGGATLDDLYELSMICDAFLTSIDEFNDATNARPDDLAARY